MNADQLSTLREGDRLTRYDGTCAVVCHAGDGEVRLHVYGIGNYGKAYRSLDTSNCDFWEVDPVYVCDCGHPESPHSYITRGYGWLDGKTYCYDCCAEADRKRMIETGKATLYLSFDKVRHACGSVEYANKRVSNWPGSLTIPVYHLRTGKHNIARTRYDVWFRFDGYEWHGVQYGNYTQIVHCKRTKRIA